MKGLLNWFWRLHRFVVRRNARRKGQHAGEACLIFGNGASLKYYDLSGLSGLPAICTANSLLDKRLKHVDVRYWVIPDPYSLYAVNWNHIDGKLAKNHLLPIKKKMAAENGGITLIASLTNYYSAFTRSKDVVYFHHFGDKESGSCDLANNFATCAGSLPIMIGAARYFGFSKAILIGCDYLGSPKLEGHFYSDSKPRYGKDNPEYVARIKEVAGDLDVTVILPEGSSCSAFKSASFEEYFGSPEVELSNRDIIDEEYLALLRNAASKKLIYM